MYDMDFLNNNDLVFGNREGVWIFRKSDTLHIDDTKGLLEINVTNICVDRSGSNKIYIGTESHGLAMYDFNKWTYWNTSNSNIPINASITDVGVDSKGNVWLGHDHLIKFDGTNWTDYGGSCTALAIDKYDNIWVGGNNGLGKFDSSSWTWYNTSTCGLPAFVPTSIAFDSHDTKWIGTDGYGLIEFNENGIVTGIRENPDVIFKNDSFNMIIYPNPTTRIVNLHLTDFQNDRLQIDITDLSGNFIKSIFDGTYAGQELNFDLSGYPSGSYFLKAVQKDKTQTYKVIKAN
jgi:hypothetical protein